MTAPQPEKFTAHWDIEMRAYQIRLERGAGTGQALEHSLIAEQELLQRRAILPKWSREGGSQTTSDQRISRDGRGSYSHGDRA